MSKQVSMLLTILFVGAVGFLQTVPAYAALPEGFDFTVVAPDANYAPGELLVRFAPKDDGTQRSTAEKNQILSSLVRATIKYNFKLVPGLTLVKLPAGQTVKDALETFNNADGILYAEPNYRYRVDSTFPNDPRFDELWGMHNTGQTFGTPDADIDAPEAWDIATRSDIIVAVLDTGVDYIHPDLTDNMWVNTGEIPYNGIDDDQITYQAQVDIDTYNEGFGAVANAVWPEKELMFITYENSDTLVWSSTKTLEKVGEFDTDIPNCAGVVVDRDKELIYIIWRNHEDLYVYSFDDTSNTVVLEGTYELLATCDCQNYKSKIN